jgi:hypothetical protein
VAGQKRVHQASGVKERGKGSRTGRQGAVGLGQGAAASLYYLIVTVGIVAVSKVDVIKLRLLYSLALICYTASRGRQGYGLQSIH